MIEKIQAKHEEIHTCNKVSNFVFVLSALCFITTNNNTSIFKIDAQGY